MTIHDFEDALYRLIRESGELGDLDVDDGDDPTNPVAEVRRLNDPKRFGLFVRMYDGSQWSIRIEALNP